MKLTKETREHTINTLIEYHIEHWREEDSLDSELACNMHNGSKGYSHYTDEELLDELVFLKWGFDLQWE